ncbi:TetR/AcrR family transcriptional regulator [Loigolactobacillus coryniformis]|uniref:TetR/AcrR family transcriptional regulator n=1 Tax=Loigolactobacillus coryniformis TaxID=1610 RepID=UPI001C5DD747|nr:TetR/AcrR family transcriptional regulator [Loigolactobacillus coryniformis]MBW4802638.1 TetR/AcrR family transcriptional regulator [Loigolactobacillus coryniformis subsp. torquens]MBW4805335.1 TetR/AcrR family transcriptional regulator [Loigolactobacillus coryniformis subsp. torquens]
MDSKAKIITAARQLIYQNGYEATSISDIMAAAAVGKGQLYYYFKSKKDIGLAVLQQIVAEWDQQSVHGILAADQPAAPALTAMLAWVLDFHRQQDEHYGCPIGNVISEMSTKDEDFRVLLDQLMTAWTTALAVKLQQLTPVIAAKEAQVKAQTIIATLQGAILLIKVHQDIAPLEQAVNYLRQSVLQLEASR